MYHKRREENGETLDGQVSEETMFEGVNSVYISTLLFPPLKVHNDPDWTFPEPLWTSTSEFATYGNMCVITKVSRKVYGLLKIYDRETETWWNPLIVIIEG